jgi:thiopeptide-type bacteriocin biosynthesis protein
MNDYTFHPKIVLRTPSESFSPWLDEQIIKTYVDEGNPFLQAVYLGSPTLYKAVKDVDNLERKTILSLTKYIIRNRSRSTPFGLFSGVGVVKWGNKTDISILPNFERHTRLDMNYLCALAQKLSQKSIIRNNILFYPNNSLYQLGDEIRYVEYIYVEGKRRYQISSVKTNEYIDIILKGTTHGLTIRNLVELVLVDGISLEEAYSFISELIEAQLIVSELEPSTTGPEFLPQIVSVLNKIEKIDPYISGILKTLNQVEKEIKLLDSNKANRPDAYFKIVDLIKSLEVEVDENKLFQTDRIILTDDVRKNVSEEYKDDLLRVSKKLTVFEKGENPNITDFISRFYNRYEDEEVPLLNALDSETGVGYLVHKSGDYTPLIEDVILPENHNDYIVKWQNIQSKLLKSLQKATKENVYEISFDSIGIDSADASADFCPTLSVMFRITDSDQIFIENIGGSSGANLIGRFAHASEEVSQILYNISDIEQKNNPQAIFAEIVHLPESRTGNILLRPSFRNYEIPYLAKSDLPPENQIYLQDIFISVRNNRVILRHKKLNKIIIPRLGTAHNFSYNTLPVYQFLCNLQTQGLQASVGFSWGDLAGEFLFLPRVSDGRAIVSPATWQFSSEHLRPLQQKKCNTEDFEAWRTKYKLPESFILADGDNELFIDSSNNLLKDAFLSAIKEKSNVIIKEYLWASTIPVKNVEGNAMANQLIATLIRNKPIYDSNVLNLKKKNVQRTFSIGSEWVYFKFYCGAKSADNILLEGVQKVVQQATENEWIDKWFFIRYTDPDYHLRVRFHLTDEIFLINILHAIEKYIKPFERKGIIWKIQTDTYRRELERYGYEAIESVEALFCIDSKMYLNFLSFTDSTNREDIKWLWGLRGVDFLLTHAGLDLVEKKALLEDMRNNFAVEFKMNHELKSQIDKKYRTYRNKIETFMNDYNSLWEIYLEHEDKSQDLLEKIKDIVVDESAYWKILSSFIHMMINRLISSNQRLHELLMYDFLYRYYNSLLARQRMTTVSLSSLPAKQKKALYR